MKYLCCLLVMTLSYQAKSQYHEDVYKGLQSTDLLNQVVETYKPRFTLDYGDARDTMFLKIDAIDRVLECVYTGLKIEIPLGADPTTAVYKNGSVNGINTEHTYPQSKGAKNEPAKSDMHNLYPTRLKANSDRSSHPFGEVPDSQTDRWYLNMSESSSIPTNNIDLYSELRTNNPLFEPRENHKGDVARSMMYFWSIYREEAVAAAPNYFEQQRSTLCDWHFQDPVDEKEWNRTWNIAKYQDDKPNPFVLDCSLAARLYCEQISDACEVLTEIEEVSPIDIEIYPNPFDGESLQLLAGNDMKIQYHILDINGRKIRKGNAKLRRGTNDINLSRPISKGLYFLQLQHLGITKSIKIIVQ